MSQHIENPDIEQFIQIFSRIFEDTEQYSAMPKYIVGF